MSEVSKDSFTNKITINKDEFCSIIREIEKYEKDTDELNKVIHCIGSGYIIFDSASKLVSIICDILGKVMNSDKTLEYGNDIEYYLYEKSKKVWINETEYDISTPEKLYEFLIEMNVRNNSNSNHKN